MIRTKRKRVAVMRIVQVRTRVESLRVNVKVKTRYVPQMLNVVMILSASWEVSAVVELRVSRPRNVLRMRIARSLPCVRVVAIVLWIQV